MADIFISYSKADRLLVERLAADLEAEGWSVWWDRGLSAGDAYRDEIMRELAAARAVVAVWTEASIKSDWVRAEAGRAKADGKLVPVKTAAVGYDAIPLPFGEMHTEPIENRALIRAAVVALLAKPQVAPAAVSMALAGLRAEALTWFGIVGGAITLFTNLKGVIQFAGWAQILVEHWQAWTRAFWVWGFSWLRIELDPAFAPLLTLSAFLASTIVGTAMSIQIRRSSDGTLTNYDQPSFGNRNLFVVAGLTLLGGVVPVGLIFISSLSGQLFLSQLLAELVVTCGPLVYASILIMLSKAKLSTAIFFALFAPFPLILGVIPMQDKLLDDYVMISVILALVISTSILPIALYFVPTRRLNRRFVFLLLGLGLLLGLNEVSKLRIGSYLGG